MNYKLKGLKKIGRQVLQVLKIKRCNQQALCNNQNHKQVPSYHNKKKMKII